VNTSYETAISNLVENIKAHPDNIIETIFTNEAGQYLISHLGVDITTIVDQLKVDPISVGNLAAKNFQDIITWIISVNPQILPQLHKISLTDSDFILTAKRWDKYKASLSKTIFPSSTFDYPGIGVELLTGYTPHLNKYSESYNVKQSYSNHLVGRQDVVNRLTRVLMGGKSVLLIGQPGVGKKTVIHEFVHRASQGELDQKLAYSRVLELNYQEILSESSDLNQKKVNFSNLINEAGSAGNVILVIKDLQRLTNSEFEGLDFSDIICRSLDSGNLKIIAISTSTDYERFMAKDPKINKYFETIEVTPPSKDEALSLLISFAQNIETKTNIIITTPALWRILEGSDRYITDIPFPEKTLELLEEVISSKSDNQVVSVDDVNKILSEKTGISMARLTEKEQSKLVNLEEIIHKSLINQTSAVSLIAQSLRGRTLGLKSEERPIGSFLFLGPTGVGKTQTAKVLADVYFGDQKNIIRFDMAEYVGPEGVARLIGSIEKNLPGALTTAIKNHPASLLLLDEMEKCPSEIFNFFLTMLDEGYLNDAGGKKINCKHLFVIATSNAGSEYIRESVQAGVKGDQLQEKVIDYVQKQGMFSPEFLNRFDGVIVYEPLSSENLIKVADLQLRELKNNLLVKNITLTYGQDLCSKIATEGYDPAFGARPMRRIIDLTLSDLLSKALLSQQIVEGDSIALSADKGKGKYSWQKL
jgi:ATP-dependent Clp protease ATP-binding subunit ClpC